jgi:hypothetical protein
MTGPKACIIKSLVLALVNVLIPELLKQVADRLLDIVEGVVVRALRAAFDIPDEDSRDVQK